MDDEIKAPEAEKALPTDSLDEQLNDLHQAFNRQFSPELAMPVPAEPPKIPYIEKAYADYVIVESEEVYYRVPYTADENGEIIFAPRAEWEKVEEQWVPVASAVVPEIPTEDAAKVGRRNNRADAERLQMIHDYARENGAFCGPSGKSLDTDDTLIAFGGEIKAIAMDDGAVKLRGPLVTFSTAESPDLSAARDFFTKSTDFGDAVESFTWFNHRLPVEADAEGKRRSVAYTKPLPKATLDYTDEAIFAEVVIQARDAYEKQIAALGLAGKLCWSSGTAAHLVDRKEAANGTHEVTRWILGLDASLTPTPAEPRNMVLPIKSLFIAPVEAPALADAGGSKTDEVKHIVLPDIQKVKPKESIMTEDELKAMLEKVAADSATAAAEAVYKKIGDAGPNVKAGVQIDVVEDEADRAARLNPFKSGGEFLMAVRTAAIAPHMLDKRLLGLRENADGTKATGLNEAIPSQGGFLVPPQFSPTLKENMYKTGSVLSLFKGDPVAGNGMTYNVVDETSRADGSRFGGVQGYWLAEGGTKTSSKPKFRQLELKLKKVAALCYATDELLEDAVALNSWLNRNVPVELRFKVEDAFVNGDGIGKPLGILSSGALKSATRVDASKISATDIGNMWAARWAGYDDYVWLGNQSIFPQLLGMTIGQQPVWLPGNTLTGKPQPTLLGAPYYDVEYLPTLGTLGDLLLVSPSAYQVIEKGGIQSASSIHVAFTTDETAFRFVYRIDAAPIWTSTLTGKDSGTYSPFVVLAATT